MRRHVADEISRRLARIFLKDENGRRPVFAHHPLLQTDPHFRDYVLFYEYFHGDSGRGVGASHQTGWTGLVAKLLMPRCQKGEARLAAPEDVAGAGGFSVARDASATGPRSLAAEPQ